MILQRFLLKYTPQISIVFTIFALVTVAAPLNFDFISDKSIPNFKLYLLLTSCLLFLIAHVVRALRLWVMLIEDVKSFSHLFYLHFFSAWIVAAVPFKLGEIYRLLQFIKVTNSFSDGIATFAIEKIFDALVVLILIVVASVLMTAEFDVRFITLFLVFTLASGFLVWSASPGLISYGRKIVLTRSRSKKGLLALNLLNEYERLLLVFKKKIDFRFTLLLLMTVASWLLDALAFSIIGKMMNVSFSDIYAYMVSFLENSILHHPFEIYFIDTEKDASAFQASLFYLFTTLTMTIVVASIGLKESFSNLTKALPSMKRVNHE